MFVIRSTNLINDVCRNILSTNLTHDVCLSIRSTNWHSHVIWSLSLGHFTVNVFPYVTPLLLIFFFFVSKTLQLTPWIEPRSSCIICERRIRCSTPASSMDKLCLQHYSIKLWITFTPIKQVFNLARTWYAGETIGHPVIARHQAETHFCHSPCITRS